MAFNDNEFEQLIAGFQKSVNEAMRALETAAIVEGIDARDATTHVRNAFIAEMMAQMGDCPACGRQQLVVTPLEQPDGRVDLQFTTRCTCEVTHGG